MQVKIPMIAALLCVQALAARADEGMWLFNQPPRQLLRERYQFDATDEWLDHLQKSIRALQFRRLGQFCERGRPADLQPSCRGGRPAKTGHAARRITSAMDFMRARKAEEIKCVDLELNVLQSIEDVTAQVNAAVSKEAQPARRSRRGAKSSPASKRSPSAAPICAPMS